MGPVSSVGGAYGPGIEGSWVRVSSEPDSNQVLLLRDNMFC